MKKLFIFSLFLFQFLAPVFSQQAETVIKPNLKYGKPSKEELSLSTYTPDTTANAIYLFHQGNTDFTYRNNFQLVTEHWVRIKVLKPQGVSYADVTVPFYSPSGNNEGEENALDIDGCSYNLENGECVKTPLKKDLISFERVNDKFKILKFSLPSVKVGTVIEYHYKVVSDFFSHIDNWMMQEDIPMIYNEYKLKIPNVLIYNFEFRGKDNIEIKEKEASTHGSNSGDFGRGSGREEFSIMSREFTFISRNLPAIRQDEKYVWCPEDYKIQISFDLQGTHFPGSEFKPYSQKWEDVDKQLTNPENELFGMHLSFENPFREETKALFKSDMNFEARIITAFQLLKKKLVWNNEYQLMSRDLNKAVKAGSGSNADLNFIFISILKDLGLQSFPVVMSRRSAGILPINYASLQKLNTFIVGVYNIESQKYTFLDSSMDLPALNVLPLELSVTQARILSLHESEENKWVNLLSLPTNGVNMKIEASLQDGLLKGHRTTQLHGQQAAEYQRKELSKQVLYSPTTAATEKERTTVSNLKTDIAANNFTQITEDFDFTMKVDHTNERLYINPMLFTHLEESPFIQSERILPVEFPYPYKYNQICTLTIPEGYMIEELPQSYAVRTEDSGMQCRYIIEKKENSIAINYLFILKSNLFLSTDYKQLQEIWAKIIEKNQASLVLKKI